MNNSLRFGCRCTLCAEDYTDMLEVLLAGMSERPFYHLTFSTPGTGNIGWEPTANADCGVWRVTPPIVPRRLLSIERLFNPPGWCVLHEGERAQYLYGVDFLAALQYVREPT